MAQPVCPHCGTPMRTEVRPYSLHGIYLGRFEFLVCPIEGRVFHPESTSAAIEVVAREKGLFAPERTTDNTAIPPAVVLMPVARSIAMRANLTRSGEKGKAQSANQFEVTLTPMRVTDLITA